MCGGRLWCYSTVYSFKSVQLAQDAVPPPCRWGCGQDQTHLMNLSVLEYRHFPHSLFLDTGLSNRALTKWLPLFIVERCLFGGKPGGILSSQGLPPGHKILLIRTWWFPGSVSHPIVFTLPVQMRVALTGPGTQVVA